MFNNHQNKLKRQYIVYADTECSWVPTGLSDKTHKHVPQSTCFYLVCDVEPNQNRLQYKIGPNCIVNMLVKWTKISDDCKAKMKTNQAMNMTHGDLINFRNATHYAICLYLSKKER